MATQITGTEIVAPRMLRVTLGSSTYRVPPSPPLSYLFWMQRFLADFQANELGDTAIEDCLDETVKFLGRYNSGVDRAALVDELELTDLILFYSRCYGTEPEAEPDDGARPTRPRRGTGGPKRTSRTKSAS